jgi:hypothetical protein
MGSDLSASMSQGLTPSGLVAGRRVWFQTPDDTWIEVGVRSLNPWTRSWTRGCLRGVMDWGAFGARVDR